MKNSEIHEGLPQREIRDFLAISMVKSYEADDLNKKDFSALAKSDNNFEKAIAIARADIKYLEKYIENLMTREAIFKLIESNGWLEHDVSDYTRNDTGHKFQMNFIGTEEEFIKFSTELYPEDGQQS